MRMPKRSSRSPFRATALALLAATSALPAAAADPSGELAVSAAASLTAAFQDAGKEFERLHPGVQVKLSFAGSPTLVQQIQEGAPVDVFASADEANMKRLVESGNVAGEPHTFARNRLAILVQKGNPKKISGLADLAKPGLVVALCAPAVPAGKYARAAFANAGVPVPESSQELDVKAVVTRVTLGEADAGIVYVTDVRPVADKAEAIDLPDEWNVVARYPIAVLKEAPHPAAAEAFVGFILAPDGRAILERFGFLAP